MTDYLTLAEASEFTKVSRATLYRLVDAGKLQIYKVGGGKRTFFKREELLALFQPKESPKENQAA